MRRQAGDRGDGPRGADEGGQGPGDQGEGDQGQGDGDGDDQGGAPGSCGPQSLTPGTVGVYFAPSGEVFVSENLGTVEFRGTIQSVKTSWTPAGAAFAKWSTTKD